MQEVLADPVERSRQVIESVISELGGKYHFSVNDRDPFSKDRIQVLLEEDAGNFLWLFVTHYLSVMIFERMEDGWEVTVYGKENEIPAQLIVAQCAIRIGVHFQIRQSSASPTQITPRFS